eukprot:TRINITY_DN1995_c0_g1_i1.p1 TRINITY_DN1995_c0_g1~~TRINITY_DN1995_c0_g1_i1.p1  ORF type:complete len:233 (-),score=85.56 TRINITY_DN1995_c0_g1_i1:287-985(-)
MAGHAETQSQIMQMSQFILSEAKDKAEEITTKALQEFSVEKQRLVNQMKEKTVAEYERKGKQIETQLAIARSTAINKSRLEKIKTRQEVLKKLSDDTQAFLVQELRSEAKAKPFITKLIVQGALMLLEDTVMVRCRACDEALVAGCLADAAAQYAQVVKSETGATKAVALTLDKVNKLPPAPGAASHGPTCLGGVVLACQNNTITIDNTIDSRLALVMDQAKPTIRQLLFSC